MVMADVPPMFNVPVAAFTTLPVPPKAVVTVRLALLVSAIVVTVSVEITMGLMPLKACATVVAV